MPPRPNNDDSKPILSPETAPAQYQPAVFWDSMYAGEDFRYGTKPNAFLSAELHRLPKQAHIVAIGDGEGRNGVYIAKAGYRCTSIEPSTQGCLKIRKLAAREGVLIEVQQGRFPYDVAPSPPVHGVVLTYIHQPEGIRAHFHAAAASLLTPGGLLLLEGFTPDQQHHHSGGPRDASMLFTPDILRADFDGLLEEVYLWEGEVDLDEGPGHHGRAAVVRYIGRKPRS